MFFSYILFVLKQITVLCSGPSCKVHSFFSCNLISPVQRITVRAQATLVFRLVQPCHVCDGETQYKTSNQSQKAKWFMPAVHHVIQSLGGIKEYTYSRLFAPQDYSTPTYNSQQIQPLTGSQASTDWQAGPRTGLMLRVASFTHS